MKTKNLLVVIAALAMTGCVSAGNNFNESRASQIQKGVTTESDLVSLFGPPNDRTVNGDGTTILEWTYIESQEKAENFIPYAGAFLGGADSAHKDMRVTLNSQGKVSDFTVTSGGMESRSNRLGTPSGSQ